MIDLSEMRVGNYYLKKVGKSEPVVTELTNRLLSNIYDYRDSEVLAFDCFSNIEITDETLKMLGFEYQNSQYLEPHKRHWFIPIGSKEDYFILQLQKNSDGTYIVSFDSDSAGPQRFPSTTKVRYIHQIQNLFKAITGKELKISQI